MTGVRVGDYFHFPGGWGNDSKGLTLEPRLKDKNLALQSTGDRVPSRGDSEQKSMGAGKSLQKQRESECE